MRKSQEGRCRAARASSSKSGYLVWLRHPDVFPTTRKKMATPVAEKTSGPPALLQTRCAEFAKYHVYWQMWVVGRDARPMLPRQRQNRCSQFGGMIKC